MGIALVVRICSAQNVQEAPKDAEKPNSSEAVAINNEAESDINTSEEVYGPVFHKVAPGETIESITRQFGITKEQFNKWNYLSNGLEPGIKVAVSFGWQKKTTPDNNAMPGVNVTAHGIKYHRVAPKETLYHLSVMYNVSMENLREWNNLADDRILTGRNLIVSK
jgi:LysM repeat protein